MDKVLYRGSKLLTLTATRYANDSESLLRSDGKHLSDHFPHAVDFSYTLNSPFARATSSAVRTARPSTTRTTCRRTRPPHPHPAR
ncbi:hypothetical protein STAFG_6605 [Streptomyces afghaniensis 772]|uniref:Uncharacterized protein n=1 Tax=Streptomyces afghaniensis 772 TaxID=1283301 RepID=S4NDL0_9ACTN|nr:hypothetical protein STAFG_6605 [Streptomyces afghaniensis 772]